MRFLFRAPVLFRQFFPVAVDLFGGDWKNLCFILHWTDCFPLLRNRRPIVQSELQAFILCNAVFFCELFQLQRAAQKDKIAVTQTALCKPLRHVAPCPHVNKLCVPL